MTLDYYGHLFPDRLDMVADAMYATRLPALAGAYREPSAEILALK
jgi:hypothetical protein